MALTLREYAAELLIQQREYLCTDRFEEAVDALVAYMKGEFPSFEQQYPDAASHFATCMGCQNALETAKEEIIDRSR